ncbi:hypothetical protein C0J52_02774 [Blattella germanica]|nr:hypothetical protein C0J52_02774 [Blattella germanica]
MKQAYCSNSVLQYLGDFDSFRFVIYTNAGLYNVDKFKANINDILNLENCGNCISFSPGDKVYTAFETWKSVKSFLEENIGSTIEGNLEKLREIVKNEAIIKEVKEKGKELEETIGDLSSFEEFLGKVEIYSSQKTEKLEEMIKKEIEIAIGTSGVLTEKVFMELRNRIRKYAEKTGNLSFLNESENFWKDIIDNTISSIQSLSNRKVSTFDSLNINFEQSHLTPLLEILQCRDTKVLHILCPGTMSILSSLKTYEAIKYENFIFTEFNDLVGMENTFLESWKTVWFKYLVVEDINSPIDMSRLIKNVSCILEKYDEKKLILIGSENGALVTCFRGKSNIFSDNYNLTNLKSKSQNVILEKRIIFQGRRVPLHSIISTEMSSMSLISNDYLCQLICSENIKIGKELKKGLNTYIHRNLARNIISMKDESELRNFQCGNIRNIITETNCPVLARGFDDVSSGTTTTNWFQKSNGRLIWKHTKGDIQNVYQFLDEENWRNYNPETLTDIEDKVVLIVGEPGMGKTTLMNQLAIQTEWRESEVSSKHKSVWIVQVSLNEHCPFLKKIKDGIEELDINTIIEFLQTNVLGLEIEMEKQIFSQSIKKQGNVVIIFDAYDEISAIYGEQVTKILIMLQNINKGRIYITSRCKERQNLEKSLTTLAFTLKPFNKGEQRKFLENKWKLKYPNIDEDVIKKFVEKLLSLASRSICDRKKNFMGVPLQVMMLENVYENYIEKEADLPLVIDLLHLYERFVDNKLQILCTEKNKIDTSNPKMQRIWVKHRQEFMKNHKLSALVALFSEDALQTLKDFSKPTEFLIDLERGIETSEIIEEVIDGKPYFIHQTFAEYFAAVWFSENFKLNSIFYINHILRSNYDVLKNIFDRILVKGKDLHIAVLNNDIDSIKCFLEEKHVNDLDKGYRTALHLAVCLGNSSYYNADDELNISYLIYGHTENVTDADHIVEILLKSGADINIKDGILQCTALKYADLYGSSFRTLGLLLEHNANADELIETRKIFQGKKNKSNIEKHLEMAIQLGYAKLIGFMIDNGVDLTLSPYTVMVKKGYTTIVHKSIFYGMYGIVDMLISRKCDLIDITDSDGNSALHLASKENTIKAVEFLIDRKCDINPINVDGNTPLHLAANSGNLDIVKYLVEHEANVEALNNEKYAAIHLAAHQGKFEVLKYLFYKHGKQFCLKGNNASTTPLHLAVRKRHMDIVKYLLLQDIDIDVCDAFGNSALHLTKLHSDIDTIKLLVDAGADVNKKNENGETVIFWAYENGGIEILKYLFEKKADFNIKVNDSTLLIFASKIGKFEIVQYLCEMETVDITICNKQGNNALHIAAQHGWLNVVSYLFDKFRNLLNKVNKDGETPLLVAALHGKWDIVQYLEDRGANIHARKTDGTNVLHIAIKERNEKIVDWLLRKKFNMEIRTKNKDTIFHIAAETGAKALLQYFFARKKLNFQSVNNFGDTLLHFAVRGNHIPTIEFLLQFNMVNRKNKNGQTPLHEAVTPKNSFDAVEILLNYGANVNLADKMGNTPLHLAGLNTDINVNIVQILTNYGASLNICNKSRNTPLDLAIQRKNYKFVEKTLDLNDLDSALIIVSMVGQWTMLPSLLEKGANVNTTAFCGITPLHVAVFDYEFEIVDYLLCNNASIHQETIHGITPLHLAAFKGYTSIVKLLLNNKFGNVNINKKDIYGNSALHCAVTNGNIAVVKLLVNKGANITIKNKARKSPLDLANFMKRENLKQYLCLVLHRRENGTVGFRRSISNQI